MNPKINLPSILAAHKAWLNNEPEGTRADLSGTYLRNANLQCADLQDANLRNADLRNADLRGAYLRGSDLRDADLQDANGAGLALAMSSHLPAGDIIGWKKCMNDVIVKLRIPEAAARSHGVSRKCRAEYAVVLEVIGANEGVSQYDKATTYRAGETVKPMSWDPDRWNECTGGIHFFITREEAEAFNL